MRTSWSMRVVLLTVVGSVMQPSQASAGPLIDWLFGRWRQPPAYAVGPPVAVGGAATGYTANYGNYYGQQLPVIGRNGVAYRWPAPSGIAAATMPQTMSFVPNYRSSAYRAPVTYYRPVLTTDPATGAQVVVMSPCTSYEYLNRRVAGFGQIALPAGGTPVVQPLPTAPPTYTLPQGGIPLAGQAGVATPYTTGYAPYVSGYQSTTPGYYPTTPAPYAQPYTYSGSCGTYAPTTTVPGLTAPPGGQTILPGTSPTPTGSVLPPAGLPSQDPDAAVRPSLPSSPPAGAGALNSTRQRPQLKSIVRQPAVFQPRSEPPSTRAAEPRRELPTMRPVPVPDGFNERPRWNPGLLQEGDMTALRPVTQPAAELAGQSKPIRWASFASPATTTSERAPAPRPQLRPIQPANVGAHTPPPPTEYLPAAPRRTYDNRGWQAVR